MLEAGTSAEMSNSGMSYPGDMIGKYGVHREHRAQQERVRHLSLWEGSELDGQDS